MKSKHKLITKADAKKLLSGMEKESDKLNPMTGYRARLGDDGVISSIKIMKRKRFSKDLKALVNEIVPENLTDIANEVWYLHADKGDEFGYFTRSSQLFAGESIAEIITISLRDKQSFVVGDETIKMDAGEAVRFHLKEGHSIPKVSKKHTWLVFMVLTALPNDEYLYMND